LRVFRSLGVEIVEVLKSNFIIKKVRE